MDILTTFSELNSWLAMKAGYPLVFVPTMGALHEGHIQLMLEARERAGDEGSVVASIFVNPLQFGPKEDFSKYPRELEIDAEKCEAAGVDAIFAPCSEDMYPENRSVMVFETKLSKVLCGASRPGHFDGVCTVVLKLLNLIQADVAIFGKKDYQQLAIIKRMVRDLNVNVEIMGSETVREADGLAMSSRNRYLNTDERQQAPAIREGLLQMQERFKAGETQSDTLKKHFNAHLAEKAPLHRVDYIECVDRDTLEPLAEVNENGLIACAVFFGNTRLIDNLELSYGVSGEKVWQAPAAGERDLLLGAIR